MNFIDLTAERGPEVPSEAILDWEYIQKKTPWGVFLIAGFIIIYERTIILHYYLIGILSRGWLCTIGRFQGVGTVGLAGYETDQFGGPAAVCSRVGHLLNDGVGHGNVFQLGHGRHYPAHHS